MRNNVDNGKQDSYNDFRKIEKMKKAKFAETNFIIDRRHLQLDRRRLQWRCKVGFEYDE